MTAAPRSPSTTTSTSRHFSDPPPVPDRLARAHARYWCFNVGLIAVLMAIGFAVSFLVPLFAPSLAALRLGGFSLPFYLGAQGAILVYLLLIAVYVLLMQRADRRLRRDYAACADEPDTGAVADDQPRRADGWHDRLDDEADRDAC